MTIEALVPDARRPGSTRVVVEGRPAWTVPADVVAELALVVGQPLRGETVERLDRAADAEGAVRAGLRALERRAHGARELATKLERKGHDPAAVHDAVTRLRAAGWLDDRAFARNYVRGRSERGRGPVRLRYDLALLGVESGIVEEAIREIMTGVEDPLSGPRSLIAKRARQLHGLPNDARRRRLLAFLGRRGYRGSEARGLVEEVLKI